jgi:hypothetical protein
MNPAFAPSARTIRILFAKTYRRGKVRGDEVHIETPAVPERYANKTAVVKPIAYQNIVVIRAVFVCKPILANDLLWYFKNRAM